MLPSNSDWAFMRREVQKFMQDTVTIYTITTTRDRYGKETTTKTSVGTSKAQLHDASGSEKQLIAALVNEGIENIETAKLALPYGTEIDATKQVQTSDGKYWSIVGTNTSQTFTAATEVLLYRRLVNGQMV